MFDDFYDREPRRTKNDLQDGRSMKRNGRVHQLNLKFSLSEIERIKNEAARRGLAMNALILLALELFFAAQPGER